MTAVLLSHWPVSPATSPWPATPPTASWSRSSLPTGGTLRRSLPMHGIYMYRSTHNIYSQTSIYLHNIYNIYTPRYQLTTRDMGPRARCANPDSAPPDQHWQHPLPNR